MPRFWMAITSSATWDALSRGLLGRLEFLSRAEAQHRNAASVDAVGLTIEGDEVAFLKLDGEQDVAGTHDGKE